MLHGREAELAHLASMLRASEEGHGSAVLLHGDAGTGKSALLEAAAALATDHRVLRIVGLESESPLPFAALHRLLRPLAGLVDEIPAPQAQALKMAFGEVLGARLDPFVIALATLSILSEAAHGRPLLCLVDDAQWLDVASAEALLFTARRMQADPVTFVFAARDGVATFRPEGISALSLAGLDRTAARALLKDHSGEDVTVDDRVVDQLIDQTGGNPLALVELPRRLTAPQLLGSEPLPRVLSLGQEVEQLFLDRCRGLGTTAQTVMLVAAADDSTRVDVILAASAELGAQAGDLDAVEGAGLVRVDGTHLAVRHPLVRSAVYQAATTSKRRQVHSALAGALAEAGEIDRAAWHLAATADGPDEGLAQTLDAAGARAAARGGRAAASAAYERAAELSTGEVARAPRLFAAAQHAYASGQASRAMMLLEQARRQTDNALLLADIARLRGRIEVVAGSAPDAHRIFVQAAKAVAAVDPVRALELGGAGRGAAGSRSGQRHEPPGRDGSHRGPLRGFGPGPLPQALDGGDELRRGGRLGRCTGGPASGP